VSERILIEQHSFRHSDKAGDLWEFTHFDYTDLLELEHLLTLSADTPSPKFKLWIKDLRHLISSLDNARAS